MGIPKSGKLNNTLTHIYKIIYISCINDYHRVLIGAEHLANLFTRWLMCMQHCVRLMQRQVGLEPMCAPSDSCSYSFPTRQ